MAALAGKAANSEELLSALSEDCPIWMADEKTWEGDAVQTGHVDIKRLSRTINPSKVRRMDPLGIISSAVVTDLYARHGKLSRKDAESTGIIFATGYGPVTAVTQFLSLIHI